MGIPGMNTSLETPNGHLARIYDRYAETRPHGAAPASAQEMVRGRAEVFRKFFHPLLPAEKGAPILDVGCGYGEFLYFLQSSGYSNAHGIDLNARQVELGSSLGVQNLRCGDSRKFLADRPESFALISAIDVLEHIPKAEVLDFLGLVHSALAPGGTFLCQAPNLAAFYTPLFYMDFSHETPFTACSLKQALELAGFAGVRVAPMGPVIHGAKSALRFLLWKGIAAGLRFVQTVEGGPRSPLDSLYTAAIYATGVKH
jgi:2-polyprenyl-3-methyl-5-hydroxy-6-metoxy-1,4-benzoquinol methylase